MFEKAEFTSEFAAIQPHILKTFLPPNRAK
jgi:hypothetical protein